MSELLTTTPPLNPSKITLHNITAGADNVHYRDEISVFIQHGMPETKVLPVRVENLLICLCTAGSVNLTIDLKECRLSPDTLIVIHPNSFITDLKVSPDSVVMIVACSRNVVENVLPKLTDLLPLLFETRIQHSLTLTEEEAEILRKCIEVIKNRLHSPDSPFKRPKMLCLLQSLLYEMMEIQHNHASAGPPVRKSRREEIMARFLLAVTENFRHERRVTHYANMLCITPKHLSAVVKDISGRTAGEWIDSYVIMEAKVMLLSTDCTIQEIASRLNFANQSFFGKYFKHLTGISPSDYRRSHS